MLARNETLFLVFIGNPFFMDFRNSFIKQESYWREESANRARSPHGLMRVTVRIGISNLPIRTRNLSLELI